MRNLFVYILVIVSNVITLASAIVQLRSSSTSFVETPARFAVSINSSGICGALHVADPVDACSSLINEFEDEDSESLKIGLIVRGKCAFEDKIRHAQDGGFHAAIVYDDQDKPNLISMIGSPEGIWMHAIFVSNSAGEILKRHAISEDGECCIVSSLEETAWTVLVISFISLFVMVSVITAAFFLIRNHRHNQRQTTSLLVDSKVVEMLPCFRFTTSHQSGYIMETCTICLEDYKDGENLRVLPCHHEFHASCVHLWLTKWGTFCPVCKHDMRNAV